MGRGVKVTIPIPRTDEERRKYVNQLVGAALSKKPRPQREYHQGICTARPIQYTEFEEVMFDNLERLNVSSLMPKQTEIEQEMPQRNK